MSALTRRAFTSALTVAFATAGVFQISIAADAQSSASAPNEAAAPVQRAKGPLEILLSQHQQRARQSVSVQSAEDVQGASASNQAKAATPSAALPAVATPPLDVQPTAPSGTANDARRNAMATTSANSGNEPVSSQAVSLGRDVPAVSSQGTEAGQSLGGGKERE